jgi:hypothetical protein
MKKMIRVPVGATATVKTHRGSTTEYLDYGWHRETLYPTSSLKSLINELVCLQTEHRDRYQKMGFEERRDCGCYHDCSCSPSYVLYGERYETDVEYEFRLRDEERKRIQKEENDRTLYERLKDQFGED